MPHAVAMSAPTMRLERASGHVRVSVKRDAGHSRLDELWQEGTGKAKFPRTAPGTPPEAVLLNTGGGMTGGDTFAADVTLAPGTALVATTQANEKIYRALDAAPAAVTNRVRVGAGASLEWLPQETILFDGARLDRRFEADLAPEARLLAVEAVVFGRTARGESVHGGSVVDAFRIRRDGRLVLADALKLDGDMAAHLARPALAAGGCALATVVWVEAEVEQRLDAARSAAETCEGDVGVSAWNGCLVARFVSKDGRVLRRDLVTFLGHIRSRTLPRVWTT
jgi:urease accessory protein